MNGLGVITARHPRHPLVLQAQFGLVTRCEAFMFGVEVGKQAPDQNKLQTCRVYHTHFALIQFGGTATIDFPEFPDGTFLPGFAPFSLDRSHITWALRGKTNKSSFTLMQWQVDEDVYTRRTCVYY